jgi:hypothetical protein
VFLVADTNTAVIGESGSGRGVFGRNQVATTNPAVLGIASDSTGVLGHSGSDFELPDAPAKTGVFGFAGQDSSAVGVRGESVDGIALLGRATGSGTSAFGLFARSNSSSAPAIGARSNGNSTAIIGKSGSTAFPTPKAKTGIYGHASQDAGAKGVWGSSPNGHGIHGESSTGWAGFFDGRVLANRYLEMVEIGTPSAPGSNHARLFIRNNGSGKTQLCVRFHTGAVRVLATQP